MTKAISARKINAMADAQELGDATDLAAVSIQKARLWFAQKVAEDIEWWYEQSKIIAQSGDATAGHQVRHSMIKCVLDKILPDKKEVIRAMIASKQAGTTVLIKNVNRGTERSVQEARRAQQRDPEPPVDAVVIDNENTAGEDDAAERDPAD